MAYLDISDFRSGLDARKYKLSLPAGTLTSLVNGHINQGGEIEKRKSFIPFALPPGTFWGQEDSTGITVFGSRAISWSNITLTRTASFVQGVITLDPSGYGMIVGGTVVISGATDATFNGSVVNSGGAPNFLLGAQAGADAAAVGTITLFITSPFQYLRLQHPDGVTQLAGVVTSCQFGAGIFSEAKFADGNIFYFFNDTLIDDFYAGIIWSGAATGYDLALNLSRLINKTGAYTASTPQLPTALSFYVTTGLSSQPAVAASGTFHLPNSPSNNQQVTLGGVTYTFVNGLNNAVANQVKRDASTPNSLTNLFNAINAGAGSGTLYSTPTSANPSAQASALNTSLLTFLVSAVTAGVAGNSIVSTTTVSNATWTSATLLGGVDAVAGSGNVVSVTYKFSTQVALTPNFGSSDALIVQSPVGLQANATGTFSMAIQPNDGDQVVVGAKTYTFKNTLNNAIANQVLIDPSGDVNGTLWSLADAVVAFPGTSGISYSSATTTNAQAIAADATLPVHGQLLFTAIAAGATAVASTTNVAGASWSCGATLRFNATLADVAASIAVAINNATDAYAIVFGPGPVGTNLGFTATSSSNEVIITPPAPLGPSDSLSVTTNNNMQVTIPVNPFTFNVFSIPTVDSGTPYALASTVNSAAGTLADVLNNTGLPVTAAIQSAGQFQIVAGTSNIPAVQTLTNASNTNNSAGDTITIGLSVYTMVTALGSAANEVLIGSNADASLGNLVAALNNQTGAGRTYSLATQKNSQVTAGAVSAHAFTVTAIVGGTPGNSIPVSTTAANLAWGAATLANGGPDTNQITQVAAGSTNLLSSYVQYNQNNTQTAIDVASAINNQSSLTGYTATAQNGIVNLSATQAGITPNGTAITVTSAGNVCVYKAFFSATPTISGTSVITQTAVGATNLMTAAITWQDGGHPTETIAQWVGRVVANINAHAGVSGWLACGIGNVIYLSKAVVVSTDSMTTPIITYTSVTFVVGNDSAVIVNESSTSATFIAPDRVVFPHVTGFIMAAKPQPSVIASGGVGPYTYAWSPVSGNRVNCSSRTVANPVWTARGVFGGQSPAVIEGWTCVVKDSAGSSTTSDTVNFYVPADPGIL